jgi:molybdopterin molybdotransferase
LLTPAEADELIGQNLTCLPIESLPLVQCVGAVLRENVYAERDQPPFDRVAMDGIALDSASQPQPGPPGLRIQGTQAAGDEPLALGAADHCIEVMTGAMLPLGCDVVVPVEQIEIDGGFARLTPQAEAQPWANIHRRASDGRQGDLLLAGGTRLTAPEIAIAAAAGMARIRVSAQPTIVVISTGNELVEPGEPVLPHQIRRSNVYGIVTALRNRGYVRVADDHVRDDPAEMRRRLRLHLDTHDVLILSGGVSMGRFDFVPQILGELGVRAIFHGIAQRPGKPMWFGIAPTGTAVFALPGNPVSTLACLARYVFPALATAMGQTAVPAEKIALAAPHEVKSALASFLPIIIIKDDEWARSWAVPRPTHGSGDLTGLAGTDGCIELPPGPQVYPKGFVTKLYRW